MSKVCAICGKKPAFGNHRSHSMVATKRRFVATMECERWLPNDGFLPQIAQTLLIGAPV